MRGLGSVQNLGYFYVLGFPIGLSPRTMQGLGSVQNLGSFYVLVLFFDHKPLHQGGESWLEAGSP